MPLHHHPFVVEWLPEHLMGICRTSCLFLGSSWVRRLIPVLSSRQAFTASVETSPFTAAPFCWLCPSPSQARQLCSAGPNLSLHHPRLPHPPYCQNLRYCSDCLWKQLSSHDTFLWNLWLSIPYFQLPLYLPATTYSLPLRHQLAFLPERSLAQHNPQSILLSLHW